MTSNSVLQSEMYCKIPELARNVVEHIANRNTSVLKEIIYILTQLLTILAKISTKQNDTALRRTQNRACVDSQHYLFKFITSKEITKPIVVDE